MSDISALAQALAVVDNDGDGRPELLADGRSVATITATLAEPRAGVEVSFEVNRGLLSHKTAITDETGAATVRVRSIAETVLLRITANADGHRATELRLELVPPAF
ncbi:Ig-like domain-containing protein [Kutzneria sp. CA-103260]|uniref:Ig-like domain-containing protein n=1 Tax=Kutzneria sp. CA-103260 TaxID=2802641 RepID=UPI001BAC54CB|nr:Ig-like domain-containing protein [Kutzneria sp. CA-103260]QUQ64772.1 Bacterial Ig-like domain (group 1) [Kutzneria sp. CA-103260]